MLHTRQVLEDQIMIVNFVIIHELLEIRGDQCAANAGVGNLTFSAVGV